MSTLDLMSDDLIDSDVEQGLGFFDWLLRVHTCVHNAHALRGGSKRRVHLPTTDVMRLRLRREHALRKAEKCWA
ncbi:MAG TPA: hypothetical protein VFY53_10235 [Rhodoplanes sp.]|nr:hypothetical protein [Rhodoplanes sp.]